MRCSRCGLPIPHQFRTCVGAERFNVRGMARSPTYVGEGLYENDPPAAGLRRLYFPVRF